MYMLDLQLEGEAKSRAAIRGQTGGFDPTLNHQPLVLLHNHPLAPCQNVQLQLGLTAATPKGSQQPALDILCHTLLRPAQFQRHRGAERKLRRTSSRIQPPSAGP